jgi:hypothetical protein
MSLKAYWDWPERERREVIGEVLRKPEDAMGIATLLLSSSLTIPMASPIYARLHQCKNRAIGLALTTT